MQNEVLDILEKYFNELDSKHKENKKQYSNIKKDYGIYEFHKHYEPIYNMKNIKEQKLHIKRLIKLIKEC